MRSIQIIKDKYPLENVIPGEKTKKSNYIFVNPCPFCGHHDHFVINKQHYHSFNGCCERGTVIDWFKIKEKLTWKEIFSMADVKPDKITEKQRQEQKDTQKEKQKIEYIFDLIYDNLVYIYKRLHGRTDLNETGIFLLGFSDFWTNRFIENGDKKQEIIETFKLSLRVELSYFLIISKKELEIA